MILFQCLLIDEYRMREYISSFFFFFQGLAIMISCIRYHHPVTALAVFGIVFVFINLFVRFYCAVRMRSKRAANHAATFKV